MGRARRSAEQVVRLLRQAEVLLGQGKSVEEACRALGISDVTYYKYRREYGGLDVSQAKRLKALEAENRRLKTAVADLTLDNQILRDASLGKR